MSIIAISGKLNSGKDTVATIIKALTWKDDKRNKSLYNVTDWINDDRKSSSFDECTYNWQIKRFANKVKDIVCLLINCTREQLEDREFKEKPLGKEWDIIVTTSSYGARPKIRVPDEAQWAHDTYVRMTPRLLLQLVGTDCGRNIIHPNLWVNSLFNEYKATIHKENGDILYTQNKFQNIEDFTLYTGEKRIYPNWIIPDMRFPNELKVVQEKDGLIIRIERPIKNKISIDDLSKALHPSETALDNVEFENVIINDGTIDELIEKVKILLIRNNIL